MISLPAVPVDSYCKRCCFSTCIVSASKEAGVAIPMPPRCTVGHNTGIAPCIIVPIKCAKLLSVVVSGK